MDRNVARGLVRSANRSSPAPSPSSNRFAGLYGEREQAAVGMSGVEEDGLKEAAALNHAERMQLAKEGKALPDGSFPIRNATDLEKARIRAHQGSSEGAAKAHIRKRAKALGVALPSGY